MNTFSNPIEERNWAMLCHLSALAGFVIPFGNIVGPLIFWAMKKDYSPLVDREGKKALNFQISMSIYILISVFLVFLFVGILFLFVLGLVNLILIVYATVKTINEEDFQYPLSIQFLR